MSTILKTKTIDFTKIIPDFKRFTTNKNHHHKVVQYIYYDGTHVMATDSHKLLKVNASHVKNLPSEKPFLFDPRKKEIVLEDLKYPEVNRLIPNDYNTQITIDYNNIQPIRKSLDELLQNVKEGKNKAISLNFKDQTLTLSDTKDLNIVHDIKKIGDDIQLYINCKYLKESLMAINKLDSLSSNPIELDIIGKLRPIVFKKEDVYDLVILPIRIHK